jgi:hypothetical protein
MDAEGLLRHRVRGIIAAAEGRAEHLLEGARRDALDVRHEAALEALDAVAEVERELRQALRRLSAMSARVVAALEADGESIGSGSAAPRMSPERGPEPARQAPVSEQLATASDEGKTFVRASMRERPVAALFGVRPDPDSAEPG